MNTDVRIGPAWVCAAVLGGLGSSAFAAETMLKDAAYVRLAFTQTAAECAAARKAWIAGQPPSERAGSVIQCFANATSSTDASRRRMPAHVLEVLARSRPSHPPAVGPMTLEYRSLGPTQYAKDQTGANPEPAGEGTVRFYEMLVFSRPTENQDDAYNDWYDHQHVPDVMRNAGFISGQRFALIDPEQGKSMDLPPYLVMFTLRSRDLKATGDEIGARIRDGRTRMSPVFSSQGAMSMYATPE